MQQQIDDLLVAVATLHEHLCPRQVLGVRMGIHAASILGIDLPRTDKRLFTFVETDGCFADGIAVGTGCWLGRRTLRLIDYGKVAATFVDTHTNRAIRIRPHPNARQRALSAVPAAPSRWHAYREAYQRLPPDLLLDVQSVDLTVSVAALISHPGARVTCVQCHEEINNAREIWRAGNPWCRGCAGDRYYQ